MTLAPAYPKYFRRSDGAMVAGVANGLAAHLRVNVAWVRITLVVLTLLNGLGAGLYIAIWILSKAIDQGQQINNKLNRINTFGLVLLGLFSTWISTVGVSSLSLWATIPLGIIAVGSAVTWFAYDRFESKGASIAIVTGVLLVLGGLLLAVFYWGEENDSFRAAVGSVLLTIIGIAALVVPFGLRLWEKISTQREEKLLADERAEMASRLHDSVLQTLALIQKRAENPDEVVRLARGQERELRQWLFEPVTDATVLAALQRASGEVEDTFGVRITPVVVGEDLLLDDSHQACILAAREAMVNAAKYAGESNIDVYAETFEGLTIYVRDRGPGFELDDIPDDRHGVRDSIFGRVERAGGEVQINSTLITANSEQHGTEVEIRLPAQ
ncbi:MAG: PspC domain-containing protein [Corynebacterium sp.]|nr:PspC domain-containing protein [Corynebacterium sp.]